MHARCTALLVTALLTGSPLGAQTPPSADGESVRARVEGTVLAAEGDVPLPGVSVAVENAGIRALTDERGRFSLRDVPAGEVVLRFQRLGFRSRIESVSLPAGDRIELTVTLEQEPIALNPVLVLMDRTRMLGDPLNLEEVPGSAHFLSRADLESQKLPFDNVHNVLRQVPGVNVQDEDAFGLRPNIGLRGTGVERSSKITIMEDGVLAAPAPYAAPSAYYFPLVGRMEAVEVRKGSSQVRYGPRTIGGALNLVSTPVPDRTEWLMDLSGGEDHTVKGRGYVGGRTGPMGWLLETYQIDTDGFKRLPGEEDTGFRIQDYVAKTRLGTARDAEVYQELTMKVGYYDEVSHETYLGLTDADFERAPLTRYPASRADVMDAEHWQFLARHFVRPGPSVDVTTTLYWNDFHRNWYKLQSVRGTGISSVLGSPEDFVRELEILKGSTSAPGDLSVRANNRSYFSRGVQSTLGVRFAAGGAAHDVELGVRFHQDQEDRFQHEDGFQMLSGAMVMTDPGAPGSQSNRVSEAEAVALYLQDEVELGSWTLVPGIRYETIDFTRTDYGTDDPARTAPTSVRENGVDAFIPGLGVTYEIDPGLHLFGGVHRGFGPPGPGADGETDAEESVNYELGTRIRRSGLALQAAGFFSDYRNVLGKATLATGGSGQGDLFNGGEVRVWGAELSADYDLAWGRALPLRLPVRAAYTYTSAEFRSAFESDYEPWGTVEVGDELPYLPEHQVSASLGLAMASWEVDLSVAASSPMRTVAGGGSIPSGQGTDRYVALNLAGEYHVPRVGTLYGGVQNLTNERYVVARRPAGARPGLPRTFLLGFRVRR